VTRGVKAYVRTLPRRAPLRWMTPAVRSWCFDGLLVLIVGALQLTSFLANTGGGFHGTRILGLVLQTAAVLALMRRRRNPVAVLSAAVVVDILTHAMIHHVDLESVQTLAAIYAVGRYRPVRTGWIAAAATLAAEGATALVWHAPDAIGGVITLPLTLALGQYVRLRFEMTARRREEAAAAAVRQERRRIARELHDVVAHHISVMSVLVGAARATMAIDPDRAAEALVTTEQTAREALAEMRQLLALLRTDGEDPEPAAGARAEHVPDLVAAAQAAGLRVELTVQGRPRELPASVDLAVYRVVQEALTNTRKHAVGACAWVRLRYELAAVDVEILDDGGAGPATDGGPAGGGYGLGGMAERVALCGGRVRTGPRPEGGFRVHARIPVPVDDRPAIESAG
jgi:signal transduction histidine kinase